MIPWVLRGVGFALLAKTLEIPRKIHCMYLYNIIKCSMHFYRLQRDFQGLSGQNRIPLNINRYMVYNIPGKNSFLSSFDSCNSPHPIRMQAKGNSDTKTHTKREREGADKTIRETLCYQRLCNTQNYYIPYI